MSDAAPPRDDRPGTPAAVQDARETEQEGGIGPYLAVLLVAGVVGLGLLVYVAGYRDEILAILRQSPT